MYVPLLKAEKFEGSQSLAADVEMLRALMEQWLKNAEGPTAILAGHYMLEYELDQKRLVPLILKDLDGSRLAPLAVQATGAFPFRTFTLGLDLLEAFPSLSPRLLLLVNDHYFTRFISPDAKQSPSWEAHVSALRRAYYTSQDALPQCYVAELCRRGLTVQNTFLQNQPAHYSDQSLIPPGLPFFSEQTLRNRFDNVTRHHLRQRDGFREITRPSGRKELCFSIDPALLQFCLTADGTCGCMGEILQLILDLNAGGIKNIIMFIPSECHYPVNKAAEAVISGLRLACRILVVTGVGGRDYDVYNYPLLPTMWSYP